MDRNSNVYTFIYASVMVILVAAILSIAALNLKPFQAKNIEIEKKQNILASVNIEASAADAEKIYADKIVSSYIVNAAGEKVDGDAFSVDMKKQYAEKDINKRQLPVFECNIDGNIKYILPMYGAGLWGPIWGYVAVDSDMNTIYGATFDHQGETPGLGAEIATKNFQAQFKGKTIFNDANEINFTVAKSNETAPAEHKVDAISGGTITSKGLQAMILEDLNAYKAFFNQKK